MKSARCSSEGAGASASLNRSAGMRAASRSSRGRPASPAPCAQQASVLGRRARAPWSAPLRAAPTSTQRGATTWMACASSSPVRFVLRSDTVTPMRVRPSQMAM